MLSDILYLPLYYSDKISEDSVILSYEETASQVILPVR